MSNPVDKRLGRNDLSPDQAAVYEEMFAWSQGNSGSFRGDLLTVGGLAGTGKTTLLGVFAAERSRSLTAYVTYTGRASSVLQRKLKASGVTTTSQPSTREEPQGSVPLCSTIHSLLYAPVLNGAEEVMGWRKRDKLDRPYKLIVVDEASMVSDDILQDIQAHGVPLLAVGDHGQLPPVAASGDLMQSPMLKLEKIHRQAEGSPIIGLAHHLRNGGRFSNFTNLGDAISFAPRTRIDSVLDAAYDSIGAGKTIGESMLGIGVLCWTNRSRIELNRRVRRALGIEGVPRASEVIVCLKNQPPVYNGMRGILTRDMGVRSQREPWKAMGDLVFPDEGIGEATYEMCVPQFARERPFAEVDELRARGIPANRMGDAGGLFDWGYAMTVHKSQGSSFDHAIFYCDRPERPNEEEWRRFAYTAITRASRKLTIVR